jgi:hypothetical protein
MKKHTPIHNLGMYAHPVKPAPNQKSVQAGPNQNQVGNVKPKMAGPEANKGKSSKPRMKAVKVAK